MIVPPKEFFPLLRRLCDDHGILLIDDEVQAGAGRTGTMWAIETWDTVPDILVSGKAIGGGLPFGGVTGKAAVMDAPRPGSLGGTFGGNPVVCAAALKAIDEIEKALPGTKLLAAGFFNNCIRLLPPINIPIPLMETALDLLEDSLDMALAGKGS